MLGIRLEGWLTILAIVLGPILAVQAQKYIERKRDEHERKLRLFRELMATRGARLSMRHVEALNLVELEYSATNEKQRPVVEAWRVYFDMLNAPPPTDPKNAQPTWDRRDDAFVGFLYEMSRYLDFPFDKVSIKRNAYLPTFHGEMEQDLTAIRKSLVEVLSGKKALNTFTALYPNHPPIKVEVVAESTPAPQPEKPVPVATPVKPAGV